MTDHDILLAAILASPADDAPRLAYADCQEERGEHELAGLIRVQCELAPLACAAVEGPGRQKEWCVALFESKAYPKPVCGPCKAMAPLRLRELGFWAGAGGLMRRDVPEGFGLSVRDGDWHNGVGRGRVRRGFIESVEMPTAAFLAHAPALFARHPITAVRLSGRSTALTPAGDGSWGRLAGRCWWWYSDFEGPAGMLWDQNPPDHWIPKEIGWLLPGRDERYTLPDYATTAEAEAALSVACVTYGRRLAGLPDLKETT